MPKIGMEPLRRAETINAALECICESGIDNTTVDMVASRAGFSKGIVSYYFKTKKQLMIESMKAFLESYNLKINSSITKEMHPQEMLKMVVEVSLPPMDGETNGKINVSALEGPEKIYLPQEKIAKLFIQFISKAANDNDFKNIMREVNTGDVEGITELIRHAAGICRTDKPDERKAAYALLAMIYGLSFFRVTDLMPSGKNDNREVAFEMINRFLGFNL